MELYYLPYGKINKADAIDLRSEKIYAEEPEKLLESEWKYTTTSTYADTAKLESTYKEVKELSLTVKIFADSETDFNSIMKQMCTAFERDAYKMTPGKLYWNDSYRNVIVVKRTPAEYCEWAAFVEFTLVFLTFGEWVEDVTCSIRPGSDTEESLELPLTLPVTLPVSSRNATINIDGYEPSDFQMIVYGPATSVSVEIGDNHYIIDHVIEEGAYLTIDSRETVDIDKRCYITQNGVTENVFNYRRTGYRLFEKIPAGSSTVICNGSYGLDLTIFKRTGDPAAWI